MERPRRAIPDAPPPEGGPQRAVSMLCRDGHLHSLWQDTVRSVAPAPAARTTRDADVVIVGAGITGLTTGLRLAQAGLRCTILEARHIGFGTTGGTTAHLNTVLDFPYAHIRKHFGEESARLVARGTEEALALVRAQVQAHTDGCAYRSLPSYTFSTTDEQEHQLDELVEATRAAGIPMQRVHQAPIPFTYRSAAYVPEQGCLHPLRYLQGLAAAFRDAGGLLLEHVRVGSVDHDENGCRIHTQAHGVMKAPHVVYATHVPPGVNLLHFRCAPWRSYVLGLKLADEAYPDALIYDLEDPYHYYRTQAIDGEPWLIAGGEDHRTGHMEDTAARFAALEAHVRSAFNVAEVTHRWSSQYFEPADGLPYIGRLPGGGGRVLVATGFGGNGMVLGTLAAIALEELIVHGGGPYTDLFDPRRMSPLAGVAQVAGQAVDVVGRLLSKPFLGDRPQELEDLRPGEARLVRSGLHLIGAFKDGTGLVHAVRATCPHAGCTVQWNNAEHTWDCPCHGSRFDTDGTLLTGPATNDLQPVAWRHGQEQRDVEGQPAHRPTITAMATAAASTTMIGSRA